MCTACYRSFHIHNIPQRITLMIECAYFAKVDSLWQSHFKSSTLVEPVFFPLLWKGNNNSLFFSCINAFFVCGAQKCVLYSLDIWGAIRWQNSHYHWSQHWHRQRNSQRFGQKRWCLVTAHSSLNATVVFQLQNLSGLCPPMAPSPERKKNVFMAI